MATGLSSDVCIALSDVELLQQVDRWIGRVDDNFVAGALDFLAAEVFERFAPEAAAAEREQFYLHEYVGDDAMFQLEEAHEGARRREAARMIQSALTESDDAC